MTIFQLRVKASNTHPLRKTINSWEMNMECSEILRPLTRNIEMTQMSRGQHLMSKNHLISVQVNNFLISSKDNSRLYLFECLLITQGPVPGGLRSYVGENKEPRERQYICTVFTPSHCLFLVKLFSAWDLELVKLMFKRILGTEKECKSCKAIQMKKDLL